MIIDLHVHTSRGSPDSLVDPQELIQAAWERGLDGVCITEHGNTRPPWVDELAEEFGFPVFAGLEASTELGDILVFGIDSYPRIIYRAAELRQFVREAGGVMIAAHPFRNDITRRYNRLSGDGLSLEEACQRRLFRLVDALEVANSFCCEEEVGFSLEVSRRLSLGGTGGSDAHILKQVGSCVTVFENSIQNEAELVAELKAGRFKALDRRLGPEKNPFHWFT